ncbi:hypothetical protein PILCRDRAFT_644064 [Piloderma croceum F 1598]|uniref:Uncharacterized protein n=1 Tax=Piloderma croceum (strain F 1598) TaxID=765440 RepID=A0A0C3F9P7_PILCF|nr:hypothetical protein PILCRDRAFT_644064 [Piloderma croceum F 1598]
MNSRTSDDSALYATIYNLLKMTCTIVCLACTAHNVIQERSDDSSTIDQDKSPWCLMIFYDADSPKITCQKELS